ncbi:restriction endonuclease subunit S [Mesobacillus foraminis]|uniref:restriction endonuclease subunit S n=1 Tax=Mesobacillus foraminis TaxID=279826 RepID=UPI0039A36E10
MGYENWVTYTLGDVCTVTDCQHKTAPSVDFKTPYKMLRTSNIRNGRIDNINVNYVTREIYEEWSVRGKLEFNDVILTREAPMGEVGIIKSEEKFFLGQRMLQLKANRNIITPDFLYYALQAKELQNQIKMQEGTGSVVSNIRIPLLKKFSVSLPRTIQQQERITKILRDIDNKIEINNEINKGLEELAQTIYKRWFIDFEFPVGKGETYKTSGGKFVDSDLGLIPEGWRVSQLNEIFNIVNGFAFQSKNYLEDGLYKVVTIKNVEDGFFDKQNFKTINELPLKLKEEQKIKECDILMSLTGNVGRVCLAYGNDLMLNQRVAKITPKNIKMNGFIYVLLRNNRTKDMIVRIGKGTAQQNLSSTELKNLPCILPSTKHGNLLFSFNEIISKIVGNFKEIETLIELRNTLLPKLMSGEIHIPEVEGEMERCLQRVN